MATDPRPVAGPGAPRELRAGPGAHVAARARTMSERLRLALSWNSAAAELRAGLASRYRHVPRTVSSAGRFEARDLFAALARHGVEYVTVGGIAVQAHGGQRLTQDLDIGIATTAENLERLAAALVELDARLVGPDGARSAATPSAAMLGSGDQWHLDTAYGALDLIAFPAHLGTFAEIRSRAHPTPLGDLTVPIASREDLLRMKRASGRPQDLADVQVLEALGRDG